MTAVCVPCREDVPTAGLFGQCAVTCETAQRTPVLGLGPAARVIECGPGHTRVPWNTLDFPVTGDTTVAGSLVGRGAWRVKSSASLSSQSRPFPVCRYAGVESGPHGKERGVRWVFAPNDDAGPEGDGSGGHYLPAEQAGVLLTTCTHLPK